MLDKDEHNDTEHEARSNCLNANNEVVNGEKDISPSDPETDSDAMISACLSNPQTTSDDGNDGGDFEDSNGGDNDDKSPLPTRRPISTCPRCSSNSHRSREAPYEEADGVSHSQLDCDPLPDASRVDEVADKEEGVVANKDAGDGSNNGDDDDKNNEDYDDANYE